MDLLVQAVQANCHIADARQAGDLPLCIYLLQMRELFRWEQGLAFGAQIDRAALGQWLAQREALWAELEGQAFVPLVFGPSRFVVFDADGINAELAPLGLVYGAGFAAAGRPSFFLAESFASSWLEGGLPLHECGAELARCLFAPAAALSGGRGIVLRRESLARWLWEKFETFSLRRADGPMKALAQAYGLNDASDFAGALPRMLHELRETLVLHERGEFSAAQWLEPHWAAMRLGLGPDQRRTDLCVRAVRDHIADLETTLPALIERGPEAALHFWFANYEGLRQDLFPNLIQGYAAWRNGDAGRSLMGLARDGAVHFRALAAQVLDLHQSQGESAGPAIGRLLAAPQAVFALAPRAGLL